METNCITKVARQSFCPSMGVRILATLLTPGFYIVHFGKNFCLDFGENFVGRDTFSIRFWLIREENIGILKCLISVYT